MSTQNHSFPPKGGKRESFILKPNMSEYGQGAQIEVTSSSIIPTWKQFHGISMVTRQRKLHIK